MEVPSLGVESELQPLSYTTATVMRDPSHICDLHHSSQRRQILNPLIEARGQTRVLMDISWIHFCCTTVGTPLFSMIFIFFIIVVLQCSVNFYCTAKRPSHTYIYIYICSFSHIILYHVLSQVTSYSSLCYTAGSQCLSTPNAIVCIY